ncbi:hypothetical protein, partial [Microbacterium sp. 13-71-7]|uniref:hypothetical protein n=1 Tax=Microbacterium sp. 13-71-7 TaxID=1970399 RepID=UPI0025E004E9
MERRQQLAFGYQLAVLTERYDSVAMTPGKHTSGSTADGGNWRRWTSDTPVIYSMRSGQLRVYQMPRPRRRQARRVYEVTAESAWGRPTWENRFVSSQLLGAIVRMSERVTGFHPSSNNVSAVVAEVAYPFLRNVRAPALDMARFDSIPVGLSAVMRSSTAGEATRHLLGRRGVRKDSVKAVAVASVSRLQ